jgi:hypothetical protein
MTRCGLPHSDIFGSKLVCSSPKLFAACHVLHRLLAPRHSPYTLSSLTIRNSRTNAVSPCFAYQGPTAIVPMQHCVCCGHQKKLPFAEYSVVKDPSLPGSARQTDYVGHLSARCLRSARRWVPTSVEERLESLVTSPKLFKERLVGSTFALRASVDNLRLACQP